MDKAPFIVFYYNSRLVCGGARKLIVAVLCMTMSAIGMENKTNSFSQSPFNKVSKRMLVLSHTASGLGYDGEKKFTELKDSHQRALKSIEEELEKKKLEVVEVKNLLVQNQEKMDALNNEKSQNIQVIATKDSEINNLNNKIEELDKKIKEANIGHTGLLGECAKKEAEYNQVVWHKKLFAIAFLACLASLIGCVLKIQHVFV